MHRTLRAALSSALATLLITAPGFAHAELRSAAPGPDDTIVDVPPELVARFTQDLNRDRTSIEVRDASGQTIARGGAERTGTRVQRVALPPLEPGPYEVRWVTFSAEDDEIARGRYQFIVEAAPATLAPAASDAPTGPGPSPSASPPAPVPLDVIAHRLLLAMAAALEDADSVPGATPGA